MFAHVRSGRSLSWVAVALAMGSAATPCVAAEPLAALLACRQIADASQRLACFDRQSGLLAGAAAQAPPRPAPPVQPAPAIPAAATAPAAPGTPPAPVVDAQQEFGLTDKDIVDREVTAGARAAEIQSIQTRITRVTHLPGGRVELTLDNGQVWQQVLADADLLVQTGQVAQISRGLLRSYLLKLPSGQSTRVRRIR